LEYNKDKAELLGFKNGKLESYETLRLFVKISLEDVCELLFDLIVYELKRISEQEGQTFAERVAEDATELPALKHDKEAHYSGYYKLYGYKADVVVDLDDSTYPLSRQYTGINESEDKCLKYHFLNLSLLDIHPKEWKGDMKYPTYDNISYLESRGTHLIYDIPKDWVYQECGEEYNIKKQYQKFHREDDFRIHLSLNQQLKYLEKKGKTKVVGSYYRNKQMNKKEQQPDIFSDEIHERSGKMEGFYGYEKTTTSLAGRPPKRGFDAMRKHTDLGLMGLLFAALVRVQNGVFHRKGCTKYLV